MIELEKLKAKDLDRFNNYIQKVHEDSCWMWTGYTHKSRGTTNRYGHFYFHGKMVSAHRFSYSITKGEIPDGLVIDHVCRVTLCVNPMHLRAVTNAENILLGNNKTAINARKTHCLRGHEFTPENTHTEKRRNRTGVSRVCRACWRIRALAKIRGETKEPRDDYNAQDED